mmetsp:Transcript_12378/g.16295  ORF Transcript_12378/g.16295 Transcript_12378/m.16295 type:complete len:140 (+) Transcript_12378:2-421(+)
MSPENTNTPMISDFNRGAEPLFSILGPANFSTTKRESSSMKLHFPSQMKSRKEEDNTNTLASILQSAADICIEHELNFDTTSIQVITSTTQNSLEGQLLSVSISSSPRSSFKSTDEEPRATAMPTATERCMSSGMPRAA